jgi:hypothetical protein
MIGRKFMAWLFPARFAPCAEERLNATISASLQASEKVTEAASSASEAAEFHQALMENVAFDARQRASASSERRSHRPQIDPHVQIIMDTVQVMEGRR